MDKLREYANEHHVPIMMEEGIAFLLDIVKERKPKHILELGTAIGFSSIQMAKLDQEIYIDTLEKQEHLYRLALENINEANLSNQIHCVHTRIENFTTDKIYDLIFIDAAKAQYMNYLNQFIDNISEDGIFIFDNLEFHGMVHHIDDIANRHTRQLVRKIKTFQDLILEDQRFDASYYPNIGDGVLILKKRGDGHEN